MSRRGGLDVIVVGAGVVGAAAALAFARDGLRVALVEAREPPRWRRRRPIRTRSTCACMPSRRTTPRCSTTSASGPACASARAQPYRAMRVWDAAGGGELAFDADAFGRRELGWIVEHALLVDRLWAALPAAGVQLHCPDAVTALEQDEHGATRAAAQRRCRCARGWSWPPTAPSRSCARWPASTRRGTTTASVAWSRSCAANIPHQATCWQRFLPTGPLAFLPFASDAHTSSIVWTLPEDEAARLLQVEPERSCANWTRRSPGAWVRWSACPSARPSRCACNWRKARRTGAWR